MNGPLLESGESEKFIEKKSTIVNRIAGRTRPEADAVAPEVEDEPLAAELRTSPETGNEQPEEYVSVYRRNANDPYARRCKIFFLFFSK